MESFMCPCQAERDEVGMTLRSHVCVIVVGEPLKGQPGWGVSPEGGLALVTVIT